MRAASSAALNRAESFGKQTLRTRVKYFSRATGSIRECQEVVDLEPPGFHQPDTPAIRTPGGFDVVTDRPFEEAALSRISHCGIGEK